VKLGRYRYAGTDAELGTLRVPVRHGSPAFPAIQLQFVRLAAHAARPGPPLIFLTGGPGLSAIRSGSGRLFSMFDALCDHGDVILLDQRACVPAEKLRGRTGPREAAWFPFYGAVTRDEYLSAIRQTVVKEASYLELHGLPPDALNTNESADDVALLARSLYGDKARVNLLGWSYGSHLAMAVLKRHESLLDRVVLAAPEGPDHTFKRPRLIQQHLERVALRAAPAFDLVGSLTNVLERLARNPERITIAGNNSENHNGSGHVLIGRFDLEWIVSEGLADTRVLRQLPLFLQKMEAGDFSVIGADRILSGAWEALRQELPHSVARYCMDCASGATAARRALIDEERRATLLGTTIDFPLPDICGAVSCPDLGEAFRAAPRSNVPVLFITGTLDCRTPEENVADLAPGLSNHEHLVVEDAGHGDLLLSTAVQSAVVQFVAGRAAGGHMKSDTPLVFDAVS
jgi:pimeloyl-ACP methyl ester carboxylesterase